GGRTRAFREGDRAERRTRPGREGRARTQLRAPRVRSGTTRPRAERSTAGGSRRAGADAAERDRAARCAHVARFGRRILLRGTDARDRKEGVVRAAAVVGGGAAHGRAA